MPATDTAPRRRAGRILSAESRARFSVVNRATAARPALRQKRSVIAAAVMLVRDFVRRDVAADDRRAARAHVKERITTWPAAYAARAWLNEQTGRTPVDATTFLALLAAVSDQPPPVHPKTYQGRIDVLATASLTQPRTAARKNARRLIEATLAAAPYEAVVAALHTGTRVQTAAEFSARLTSVLRAHQPLRDALSE